MATPPFTCRMSVGQYYISHTIKKTVDFICGTASINQVLFAFGGNPHVRVIIQWGHTQN